MKLKTRKTMKIRLVYTMEMYVEGDTLKECRKVWESANLADGNFVQLNAVEDEDFNEMSVMDFENS